MDLSPEQVLIRGMAEEDVRLGEEALGYALKWQRRNRYWFYWYTGFGTVEFVLGTVDWITGSSLFTLLLTYGVALMQVPLALLNRRAQRLASTRVRACRSKLRKAEENLRLVDPSNAHFPLVIEEEP